MNSKFLGAGAGDEAPSDGAAMDVGGQSAEEDEVIYKIDIPANRYDLLCLEGIAKALNVFRGQCPAPTFRLVEPPNGAPRQRMIQKPETLLIRPFVVCAVLRGVAFDKAKYDSFIDLQDKLHQNICRRRTLVAIGTHDLGKIRGPFTYEAKPPEDIEFVPLKQTESFRANDLMEHYKSDQKLKHFLHILEGSTVFPVIYDADRTVLSLPPIINGAKSAISLDTTDVFIECTATDLNKAKIVLNTVVTMFSQHCASPFCVEPVDVVDAMDEEKAYPDFMTRFVEVDPEYVNKRIGVDIAPRDMAALLCRMQLPTKLAEKSDGGEERAPLLRVEVPPTRSDVLHPCDVAEDVAIAHGYNNIQRTVPPLTTVGAQQPLNHFSDLVRNEMAYLGFSEVLTWILCSHDDNFANVNRVDNGVDSAAIVANPSGIDVQVARSSLLQGVLKAMGANKDAPVPVKLFEVGDVVLIDPDADVGARNARRLLALFCGKTSGFEVVHGVLDRVMVVVGAAKGTTGGGGGAGYDAGYEVRPCAEATFFPGRQAKIVRGGREIGTLGVVHPDVLARFDVVNPCSVLELDLEPLMDVGGEM